MARIVDRWGSAAAGAAWTEFLRPAPDDLRLVQAFVNTAVIGSGPIRPRSSSVCGPPSRMRR